MEENILRSGAKVLFRDTGDPPFFWIGCLDIKLVSEAQDGRISINRQVFEKNAKQTWALITEEFPDALTIYMDFVRYLRKSLTSSKKIVFEMPILRDEKGRERVKRELDAIAGGRVADLTFLNPEDSPFTLMGKPAQDSFIKFSNAYQSYLTKPKKDKQQVFNRSLFIQFIALFASNIVMTGMIISSLVNNGFSTLLFAMMTVNFITYYYSLYRIREQWKLYQAADSEAMHITREERLAQELQMQFFNDSSNFEDDNRNALQVSKKNKSKSDL